MSNLVLPCDFIQIRVNLVSKLSCDETFGVSRSIETKKDRDRERESERERERNPLQTLRLDLFALVGGISVAAVPGKVATKPPHKAGT